MSFISTVTSSLPNVLNLLQGKWTVEYKIAVKPEKDKDSTLEKLRGYATTAMNFLNSKPNKEEKFEWKELDFDSFIDVQEILDSNITQNPVEEGSFRSENKIKRPRIVKVTLAKAGVGYGIEDSIAEIKMLQPLARYTGQKVSRYGLNAAIEKAKDVIIGGIKKMFGIEENEVPPPDFPMEFRILTPFDMIENLNLVKADYTFKKDNGRNMLIMYLTFQEILEVVTDATSVNQKVKTPTDSENENIGRISAMKG